MTKRIRLDRMLTTLGVATRSEAKALARQGKIAVNGQPVRDTGLKIDPNRDEVTVAGQKMTYQEHVYVMLNKPPDVISATTDARHRTVLDLLDPALQARRPFPVGRLDKDTEGLLLLTTDGELAHRLLSPRKQVPKTYTALVEGEVDQADVAAFRTGVTLDDGYVTMPAELVIHGVEEQAGNPLSRIDLTIREGKFHQVKRMFRAVGKEVLHLKRISMGPLALDPSLASGAWRELTPAELDSLEVADKAP